MLFGELVVWRHSVRDIFADEFVLHSLIFQSLEGLATHKQKI